MKIKKKKEATSKCILLLIWILYMTHPLLLALLYLTISLRTFNQESKEVTFLTVGGGLILPVENPTSQTDSRFYYIGQISKTFGGSPSPCISTLIWIHLNIGLLSKLEFYQFLLVWTYVFFPPLQVMRMSASFVLNQITMAIFFMISGFLATFYDSFVSKKSGSSFIRSFLQSITFRWLR